MSTSWYEQDPNAVNKTRIIPGAGTYLQEQAKAQSAYERAVAQLGAQRARRQIQSGLGKDWSVDPHSQYGTYQQMLSAQGGQLDEAREGAQLRGFFGAGLGNQGESALRYGHAVQSLGFKNQLADWENEYQQGLTDAQRIKQEEMLSALQGAAGDAFSEGDFTPYDPYGAPPGGAKFPPIPPGVRGVKPGKPKGKPKVKPKAAAGYGGGLGAALINSRGRGRRR